MTATPASTNPLAPLPFIPRRLVQPPNLLPVPSAWPPSQTILADLLDRAGSPRHLALEFGTDYGYSAVALSCYFDRVVSVDNFEETHSGGRTPEEVQAETERGLYPIENITLVRSDAMTYTQGWDELLAAGAIPRNPDLVHLDADHSYQATKELGLWAVRHSPLVLFHDVLSFPDTVGRAVLEIAQEIPNLHYYLFGEKHGLGILSRKELRP